MNNTIGIVIVNYNSEGLLNNCLNSVFEFQNENIILKVVVVDNNSKDSSLELSHWNNPNLKVLKNRMNRGFGYACNQGVEKLDKVDYLLFLNPDTEVKKATIERSINFLIENDQISILGVLHKDQQGNIKPSCSRRPSPKRIIFDIIGMSKCFPKIFKPSTVMTDFNHTSSRYVDQVMGAYMLMKKSSFEKVGGFDTRFFVYYEDADFALRANKLQLKSYYNANIEIMHRGRGTTEKISDISLFYNLRSKIQFVEKHYGKLNKFIILFLVLTVEPITRFINNLIVNPTENKNMLRSFRMLYIDVLKNK